MMQSGQSSDAKTVNEYSFESEDDKKKRIELLLREEEEISMKLNQWSDQTETTTVGNKYHYSFRVPVLVYQDEESSGRLNKARTMREVGKIIKDYRKHHGEKSKKSETRER